MINLCVLSARPFVSKPTLSKKETAKRDHYIHGEGYVHRS